MVITAEETAREKERLPRGWGRFGKGIDGLIELSEPDESLLSACVGLNPAFKHRTISLAGGLMELTKATNLVLGATDRRLILLATGAGGGPRSHFAVPYDGLQIANVGKKDLALRWPEHEMHIKGMAKQMLPGFVEALSSRIG